MRTNFLFLLGSFIILSTFLFSCKKDFKSNTVVKSNPVEIRDSLIGKYVGIRIAEYYDYQLQQVAKDTTNGNIFVLKNATDSVIDVKLNFPNDSNIFYFKYDSVSFTSIRNARPGQLSISNGQLYHFWFPSNGSRGITTLGTKN